MNGNIKQTAVYQELMADLACYGECYYSVIDEPDEFCFRRYEPQVWHRLSETDFPVYYLNTRGDYGSFYR